MSDTEWDVVLAAYMIQDRANEDYERLVKLVQDKELQVEGLVLATKDVAGEISLKETDVHLGREELGIVGGLVAKFAKHWLEEKVEKGLEEKMDQALAPGWAAVVAIYDRSKADTVDASLVSAVKKSVAHVDGHGAKQLKAALEEAAQGK